MLSQNNGWLGNATPNAMHNHCQYFKILKKVIAKVSK
jgi:hypothetical protein